MNISVGMLKEFLSTLPDDMEIYGAQTYEWDTENLFPLVIAEVVDLYPNSKSKTYNVVKLEVSTL